ncbi:MAG TPA: hypothetical protein VF219_17695 [Vicinamibacterales bacterium]
MHVHVYAGTGERGSYAGDNSVYPDGFTLRSGVTTVVDAGSSGWRSFDDFKDRIIDRSRTRVLAFLNIVGAGMRGDRFEQNLADMDAEPTSDMALRHKDVIVGIKTAHYAGPEWTPVERAVEAGTRANIPVMVDFGTNRPERPMAELVTKKLRPGDIYTHRYSGLRNFPQDNVRKPTSRARLAPQVWTRTNNPPVNSSDRVGPPSVTDDDEDPHARFMRPFCLTRCEAWVRRHGPVSRCIHATICNAGRRSLIGSDH